MILEGSLKRIIIVGNLLRYYVEQLNIPAYVILWSTTEDIVKIQKVKQITDNIYFDEETTLPRSEIENFFKQ